MALDSLARGAAMGFCIAAPVGPIGLLCIRRTLAEGRAAGFVSGLGAATADALYGCVAGLGLTAISGLLVGLQGWLKLGGGIFLVYLGWRTTKMATASEQPAATGGRLRQAYLATILLTLANPMTILSFAAVLAGLGAAGGGRSGALALVAGVFLGSAAWWLLLSLAAGAFRERLGRPALAWVNRASGAALAGFGLLSLWSLR